MRIDVDDEELAERHRADAVGFTLPPRACGTCACMLTGPELQNATAAQRGDNATTYYHRECPPRRSRQGIRPAAPRPSVTELRRRLDAVKR